MLKQCTTITRFGLFGLLFLSLGMANAQNFPAKPVTLVIPKGAGGGHDLTARALSTAAQKYFGQPLIVQLKPGGGGVIGVDYVANSSPDGYTLLLGDPGINVAEPALNHHSKGPDDLEAVCQINSAAIVMAIRPDAPYKTLKEMVAWSKENPGKLVHANTGTASNGEFVWKLFLKKTGITGKNIPYEGGGPSMLAVIGGHADLTLPIVTPVLAQVKAKKLIAIAVLTEQRDPALPDVPTVKESGIDLSYSTWKGVLAPKGTPRAVVEKLATAFKQTTEDPVVVKTLAELGDPAKYIGPEQFARNWRAQFETFKANADAFK
jgi:tripartite-type tricarboxylate transporter receptor subunit TctC